MKRTILKRRRLEAYMTQTEVAEKMGISQPNYQRWESGAAAVPAGKIKKLARILKSSVEEIAGKPQPFDIFGVDEKIGDTRTYFGEAAIHFINGKSLLFPISEAMRSHLFSHLQTANGFAIAESLDNRTIFIRRSAITDVYFSSEAFDTYGPEKYKHQLGIFPDNDFWRIVEYMEFPEELSGEIDKTRIEEVLKQVQLTDEDLDYLIESGNIKSTDREKVAVDAAKRTQKFQVRARRVSWQLSSGAQHWEDEVDDADLYDAFGVMEIDPDDEDDLVYLKVAGGYDRSVLIKKSQVDYFEIPTHKFKEGCLDATEDEIGD